jgi:uncharacterized protein
MAVKITVSYATPGQQVEIPLQVEESCTVAIAIQRSGILEQFSEIRLAEADVGICSRKVRLDSLLQQDDRIEIYRPLQIDPKQARLLRASRNK